MEQNIRKYWSHLSKKQVTFITDPNLKMGKPANPESAAFQEESRKFFASQIDKIRKSSQKFTK